MFPELLPLPTPQAVQWLREHDEEAQQMVTRASSFVRGKLNRPARICYLQNLLHEISRAMRYKPVPCVQRGVCVPLLRQLSHMGHYSEMRIKNLCDIHLELDTMHGSALSHGEKIGQHYGDLK